MGHNPFGVCVTYEGQLPPLRSHCNYVGLPPSHGKEEGVTDSIGSPGSSLHTQWTRTGPHPGSPQPQAELRGERRPRSETTSKHDSILTSPHFRKHAGAHFPQPGWGQSWEDKGRLSLPGEWERQAASLWVKRFSRRKTIPPKMLPLVALTSGVRVPPGAGPIIFALPGCSTGSGKDEYRLSKGLKVTRGHQTRF